MRQTLKIIIGILAVALNGVASGCSREKNHADTPDESGSDEVLVAVGDSALRMEDVIRRIPAGLSPEDSTALFKRIVSGWVRDLVLRDVAEKNITDLDKIEKMVESYRNNLIVNRYLSNMMENIPNRVTDERIKKYYEQYGDEMILEQPVVKGAYLKVGESAENIDNLRKWMMQFTDESIDKIENSGLRQASQYEYFKDTWQEWNVIAEQIPYRFYDADAFLKSVKNFETSDNGIIYLLHISEYIPSGEKMPYEFAKVKIAEILRSGDVDASRTALLNEIYRHQISEGKLKPGVFDPLSGEIKSKKK
ncbi:MAG: peptidylprolyl isomerase [Candidatus Amulumruptor caecigallinarius]|nr:peptidylprolyl isomerase [Candidatus Amulumruptor caecigallinarius]